MIDRKKLPNTNRLSAAILAAMLGSFVLPQFALAQDSANETAPQTSDSKDKAKDKAKAKDEDAQSMEKVIVTGSLIPQTELETFTPVTIISAEDIKVRGYTQISDAVKESSFATGGVQGSQSSASFTQGAETASLFGLSVGYTKYLIDGRPMADYPALYNGSDAFNNISGIPIELVDRIEILPGGQSSLYGSDAIAGVINIILKKQIDNTVISVRGGAFTDGGGDVGRISAASGFSAADDRLSVLVGAQYEKSNPIWGYDRELTRQYNLNGTSAALVSRDWLIYSPFTSYNFPLGPEVCRNVGAGFGGTIGLQVRPGFGDELYCGSPFSPGYRTLKSGKDAWQLYTHATFALNDSHELYGNVLYSREEVDYHIGSSYTWWGTGVEWGYFYDPDADDLLNLQRVFVPEDWGSRDGYENSMSTDISRSYAVNFGSRGMLGESDWDYDASVSHTNYDLDEQSWARFAGPINEFFRNRVLGPQQGLDPYYGAYPVFTPDYSQFYTLLTAAEMAQFSGDISSRSNTSDTMLRAQFTNASLFSLSGGDAGVALAVEGARQDWDYSPDPRLLNGEIWGTTATDGRGERDRYAVTGELRLPVFEMLTASLSSRYDSYHPDGADSSSKATYSLGLEFRPIDTLLFRGKLGTAFKAPTLPDQFQAPSGYYSFVTDYYRCAQAGFTPDNIDACPAADSNRQFFGQTEGGLDLKPLTADVWSAGVVWAPMPELSFAVDYHDWDIRNEIQPQSAGGLALREYLCRTGQPGYDINSPTCQEAIARITRNATGRITEISTPKVNEAQQLLEAVTLASRYELDMGKAGGLMMNMSYTKNINHESVSFVGDEAVDLMNRPGYSSDPHYKANASATWSLNQLSTTLYANHMGPTPNNRARTLDSYSDPRAGKLSSFTLYNLSVNYAFTDALGVSLMVNNLFNSMPPFDPTYPGSSGAPYNSAQYSPFGRAIYVEARYDLGK